MLFCGKNVRQNWLDKLSGSLQDRRVSGAKSMMIHKVSSQYVRMVDFTGHFQTKMAAFCYRVN